MSSIVTAAKRYPFNPRNDLQNTSAILSINETDKSRDKMENGTTVSLPKHKLVIIGVSLDSYSRAVQLSICCGGVFVFFLVYGYVQVS